MSTSVTIWAGVNLSHEQWDTLALRPVLRRVALSSLKSQSRMLEIFTGAKRDRMSPEAHKHILSVLEPVIASAVRPHAARTVIGRRCPVTQWIARVHFPLSVRESE